MEFFRSLGDRVDRLWQLEDYDESRFPGVARRALEDLPPREHTGLLEIVCAATSVSRLPAQSDLNAQFGDPPLTVFEGRNFRIEVLFWLRGVPEIHQHGFSGAFHVLEGSSIHTQWRFIHEDRVDMRLVLGRVELTGAEILKRGDNREIIAGARMYHATYHMEKPSLTVVIRTLSEADKLPQYSLLPPFLAYASTFRLETVVRQAQLLNMFIQVDPARFVECTRELLSTKDGYWVYEVLNSLWRTLDDEDAKQLLLAAARQRHPRLIRAVESTLERSLRDDRLIRVRLDVADDQDLRYLLALLRNVPDGGEIRRLLALRFPDRDVLEVIEVLVRRLSSGGALNFRIHETWIVTLGLLLRDYPEHEITKRLSSIEDCPSRPSTEDEVHELCDAIRYSWLFGPLFSKSMALSK